MANTTRREFIAQVTTLTGFCLLDCEIFGQCADGSKPNLALNDKTVAHGMVQFKAGDGMIDGYLSRPKARGRNPVVIVVTGSSVKDESIQNMTAMFAQAGFVGIAPNIFWLQKDSMTLEEKRKVFVEQITDELIFRDIQASIDYLKTTEFVNRGRIGITGFCFGGRTALMFAAQSKKIDAVAPFYGNLRTPAFANRQSDPLDVLAKIRVPVQGHYARVDNEIPLDQLKTFEDTLRKQGTPVEIFTYEASHGFFALNRTTHDAAAASLAWTRTVDFFKKYLKK
jgi:carboxymethylenebutenolidase